MVIQVAKQKDKTWNAYVINSSGDVAGSKEGFEKMVDAQIWAEMEKEDLSKKQ